MTDYKLDLTFAKELDKQDPLYEFRNRFYLQPGEIYMDGNSCGLASIDGVEALNVAVQDWIKYGVTIWTIKDQKYFLYQYVLAELMAPLINAKKEEVTVMDSTTINIHKAIATLYKPTKERYKILVDDLNFPTDRYAVDGQVKLHGYSVDEAVVVVRSKDGRTIDADDVIALMSDDIALIHLPSVLYRSGQLLDMKKITEAAHARGILIGWDLCHSIGSVPHDFNDIEPDYAVWCNYKYVNGGPGAIAGFYVNERHFELEPALCGWQGNKKDTQFLLLHQFEHDHTASGWLTGTQPVLSMAPIEGSLKMFNEAGMDRLREKSLKLTSYLMYLIDHKLTQYGAVVGTPRSDEERGGHVSLEHDEAYRITLALKKHGVTPDFREPNVVRLAPTALYTSFEEVYQLVEILIEIFETKEYESFSNQKGLVV